ncbi:hypothetical protein A1O7_02448 [Cladophialophora yegresii CBS 114405]|uniref:NTF2-like domain-containing protein n=1 Tax=Cladophialophora yegresii CBS 114405 TaxID=1182544 RepID=W9WBR8_9EURO|nr:uncharacterized protein A1O7_02448 [Cladophialophora yegresii CBS 114405]EXJ62016.1 hypothetical protein A1O7_02448 [Cladophialophora yegresii CBS 114405]
MWATGIVASLFLASPTSATYLGLFGRANRLCPAVVDTIAVTSTVSITVPAVTVTVSPTLPLASSDPAVATCLSDTQATSIVGLWKSILTHADRNVANSTAQRLITNEFLGTSDSINSLAGTSLGNATFSGKDAFITATLEAPPIALLTTLDIFHDCSRIAFYWAATGVGSGAEEIRGIDLLYLTDDQSQINMAMTEFNSLAWAKDVGWKSQRTDGTQY